MKVATQLLFITIRFHIITIGQVVSLVLFGILVFCALGKYLWNAKGFSHNQHFRVCNHFFFSGGDYLNLKRIPKPFEVT